MPEDTQNLMPDSAKVAPSAVEQASSTDVNGLASNGLNNQIPAAQASPSSIMAPGSTEQPNTLSGSPSPDSLKNADNVYPSSGNLIPPTDTDTTPPSPTPLPTDSGAAALELPKEASDAPVVVPEQTQYNPAEGSAVVTSDQRYAAH